VRWLDTALWRAGSCRLADMRAMLDTMIFDELVADPPTLDRVRSLVEDGRLTILLTHIQRDQLARISDDDKRAKVLAIPAIQVNTRGLVFDTSRWDQADFGDDATNTAIDEIKNGGPQHAADALIAATADGHADMLVTNDRRLANRVRRSPLSVRVVGYGEWVSLLMQPVQRHDQHH